MLYFPYSLKLIISWCAYIGLRLKAGMEGKFMQKIANWIKNMRRESF